jgi:hypothetical protein
MKNLPIIFCLLFTTPIFAQDFYLGLGGQVFGAGDNRLGFEPSTYWANSYQIWSPVMLIGKLEFGSGIYFEAAIGQRTEKLFRRTKGPFEFTNWPHNAFTSNSHKRTFYLLDLSSSLGYVYHIKRFGFSGELGSSFSKVYFMRTQSIDLPDWVKKVEIDNWIRQRDFMADVQVGLGVSYLINKRVQVQVKFLGRGRLHTTKHFQLKGRPNNGHPSHNQKYLIGSQFSIAYNLWD